MKKWGKLILVFVMIFVMIAEPINVYAASGNGTTGADIVIDISTIGKGKDCWSTFENAFRLARDNGTDGKPYVILVKRGDYNISRTLHIYSNTYVKMENGARVIRNFDGEGTSTLLRNGNSQDKSQKYNGYRNITFEGGIWDGNGQNAKSKHFSIMRIGHMTNFTLKNVTMQNDKGAHCIEFGAVKNVNILGCTFKDQISGNEQTAKEVLEFDVTYSPKNFAGFETYDNTACENVTIKNCVFSNIQRGVGTHTSVLGVPYNNFRIENNTFTNIAEMAVNAQAFKNSYIVGNKMTNVTQGVSFSYMEKQGKYYFVPKGYKNSFYDSDANTVISKNIISIKENKQNTKVQPFGIRLMGENVTRDSVNATTNKIPVNNYYVKNVSVSDNTISIQTRGHGVRLIDAYGCKVNNNKISFLKKGADNQFSGITLAQGSRTNSIQGNTITGAKKYAIGFANACSGNVVENNIIRNSYYGGIHFSDKCNSNTIKGNTINNTRKGNAIGITGSCGKTGIYKNKISKASGNGISLVTKNSATISGNTVTGCGNRGINVADNSRASIKKNVFSGNKSFQIDKDASSRCNVPIMQNISVNPVKKNTSVVTGTVGGRHSRVIVQIGNKKVKSKAKNGGFFAVKIGKQKVNTSIRLQVVDAGGNKTVTTIKVGR